MIRKQPGLWYWVGDKAYASLAEAQTVDLVSLMDSEVPLEEKSAWASWLLKNSDAVAGVLAIKPEPVRKTRRDKGKPRKAPTAVAKAENRA